MYNLAIDTANSFCTVALYKHEQLISQHDTSMPNMQAKSLTILVNDIITQNHLSYYDVHQLIVTAGPGSFTGVRIGLAYAKGYKIAAPHIKIYAISTLAAIAYSYMYDQHMLLNDNTQIIVIQNASRAQLYVQQFFLNSNNTHMIQLLDYKQTEQLLNKIRNNDQFIIGSGVKYLSNTISNMNYLDDIYCKDNVPTAQILFKAFSYMQKNNVSITENIQPVYLRPAV